MLYAVTIMISLFIMVESTFAKGENAGYLAFFPFHTMFSKGY